MFFLVGVSLWANPQPRVSVPLQSTASQVVMLQAPPPQAPPKALTRSQVFFLSSERVVSPQMKIDSTLVREMLDRLICAVTRQPDTKRGWQSLLKVGKEGDRVGIKVATEPGVSGGTHPQLVQALVAQLVEAGVERNHIFIADRRRQDLEKAGFIKHPGWQLRWMEYGNGYDPQKVFTHPLVGQLVYGDFAFKEKPGSFQESLLRQEQYSNESHYASFVTQQVDKIINVPSLCDSWYAGVNGALINMSLGVVDNWRRFVRAPYFASPYASDIFQSEPIHSKVIMNIMDGLMLQYAGGPQSNPSHVVPYGMLLASRDPVALDATALTLINRQRQLVNLPRIQGLADHIQAAEAAGLGNVKTVQTIRVRLP
ncbi:MAG: DUF362 domain-containing protein [Verrucomicrobia bacterium]|nr:DUF362 domain-containing protein [Verrucomicrobiota bacterium]